MDGYRADDAETLYVDGATARFGYRRFGPHRGAPIILALRLRGTIDHWDPAFLEVLSIERDVIVFDNRGLGLSSGAPADTVDGMADGLLDFAEALGLPEVDLLGWSLGGYVVQTVALARPGFVRRLVVAGSGPGRVPGLRPAPPEVMEVAAHAVNDDADFLYLFFPETPKARELGIASLRRLDTRLTTSQAAVGPDGIRAQMAALASLGHEIWERLADLTLPVLVGAGAHDVMVNPHASFAMSQQLPDAKVVIYSDAGHGFLFQHPEEFGREVLTFLR